MKTKVSPAEWVGRLIDQRFPLFEHLGSADSGDFFRTELPGPHALKAAIRLVSADIDGAQEQFDDWAQAEGLTHPHLLRIFESGHGRIDENEFLYVVMELPDEALDQVLPTRTLSGPEAGEMLPPIIDALQFIHAQGMVHGHLTPSNILVVGDQVKLSADALQQSGRLRKMQGGLRIYDAPETAQGDISPASDVWSLGITLVEALTQLPPMRNPGGDPGVPRSIPEPFAEIARNCLRVDPAQRASLHEIRAALSVPPTRTSAVPLTAPVAPVAPARVAPGPVSPAPASPVQSRPAPPPAQPSAPSPAATQQPPAAAPPQPYSPSAPRPQPAQFSSGQPSTGQAAFDDRQSDEIHPQRRSVPSVDDESGPPPRISTPFIIGMVALLVVLVAALFVRSHKSASAPAPDSQDSTAPAATAAQPPASSPAPPAVSHAKAKAAPSPAPSRPAKPSPETPVSSSAATAPPTPTPAPAAQAPPAQARASQAEAKGEVTDRVMPEDRAHADRTIHGKVALRVRLSVDREGNVSDATLDQPGPSRYFDKIALEAARKWRFRPPQVNGSPAPSTWLVRFEFRRDRTDVFPTEVTR